MASSLGKVASGVKRLKEESGCYFANTERGSTTWTLCASSTEAIERFVALAGAIVPGCEGRITEVTGPSVIDIALDR